MKTLFRTRAESDWKTLFIALLFVGMLGFMWHDYNVNKKVEAKTAKVIPAKTTEISEPPKQKLPPIGTSSRLSLATLEPAGGMHEQRASRPSSSVRSTYSSAGYQSSGSSYYRGGNNYYIFNSPKAATPKPVARKNVVPGGDFPYNQRVRQSTAISK